MPLGYVTPFFIFIFKNFHTRYEISFSNIRKPGISGAKNKDLLLCKDNKEYKIYTSIKSICFIGDSSNKKANKVKINGQFVDLKDALEIVEQGPSYAYIIDCEKYQLQNGWIKIELVNIVDNKTIDKYKFLYDETLETQAITSGILYKIHNKIILFCLQ